jgi:flagellar hook-associated protein 1 FlgK
VGSHIVVGGRLDINLAEGISLGTTPADSMIFGDVQATDSALPTYLGIQASISGSPQAGDRFTLDFNSNASWDNRNALKMIELQQTKIGAEGVTFNQAYGTLVEKIGIDTSSAKINRNAAERVLQQSEELRNSISGVNLDEEAADLIRFEQLFSANAQVISVARDIFDRLINAF